MKLLLLGLVAALLNASSISVTISGIAGPTLALSGAATANVTSAGAQVFTFAGLANGTYTFTPALAGYTFTPASQSVVIKSGNQTISFTASAVHSVSLGWGAGSIVNPPPGRVVAGYNVYRSLTAGGPYTKLNAMPVPQLFYTDTTVQPGTYYYVSTTVDNLGNLSPYSNQLTATVP
jgi:hypothetical protein